jgi:cation diffusion facilitator family transporter
MPDDDNLPKDLSHITPTYRRALWIVVLLNVGYGLAEMIGGFLADSQALKADALDFLGDGSITLLGLLAIGWGLKLRARSALIQGIFLGAMGIAILANTIYRTQVLHTPEAELMGILGFVALLINAVAVIILIPHRKGDANIRAVWLFSRNDAFGNILVIVAAGFVFWTSTSWPDLIAAGIIASLFLQSSWSIIKDARNDLKKSESL